MKLPYKKIWLISGAFLFNACAIAFFGNLALNIPLLTVIFAALIASKRNALIWTLATGIIMETVSPFPIFAYLMSMLTMLVCLRIFTIHYMSGNTIFGTVISAALGILCFEAALKIFARIISLISSGWVPLWDQSYFWFLSSRFLWSIAFMLIISLFTRKLSPRIRGVSISAI